MNETRKAIKTMRAPILWDRTRMTRVYYYGEKNIHGEAIWYDDAGNTYELIYARMTKRYSLNPTTKKEEA